VSWPRLDTVREVETPEGIFLRLRLAGPVVRALAWFLDSLIRYVALWVLLLVLSALGRTGLAVSLILFFALEWFYPVLFELAWAGATPGKRLLGLRVINDNGTPVDVSASVIRNLLRAADFLPVFYTFGLLSMLLNRDFKRLGDLAAGTVVIYREPQTHEPVLPAGPAAPPPLSLSGAEGGLLIAFAERSDSLSEARRRELAEILAPLARDEDQPVESLLAQARWLLGRKDGIQTS